jgi:hypothetical protein
VPDALGERLAGDLLLLVDLGGGGLLEVALGSLTLMTWAPSWAAIWAE